MLEGITIRPAIREQDHKSLCALAKRSKYISSFSSIMFSSEKAYELGWIRLAEDGEGNLLGFTCVRHKTRAPETMLYFIMTDPDLEGKGIGQALMKDLELNSTRPRIALKVMNDNPRAIDFYKALGYDIQSSAYDGKGVLMWKELKQ